MNRERLSKHVGDQITDFVLDLLPADEKQYLTTHLKTCARCRQLVTAEERIGLLVRSTVEDSGRSQAELSAFMPRMPAKRAGLLSRATVRQQLAVAALAIILFLAGFNLMLRQEMNSVTAPVSTAFVATAPYTQTPVTATMSPTPKIDQINDKVEPSADPIIYSPLITPAPPPNLHR